MEICLAAPIYFSPAVHYKSVPDLNRDPGFPFPSGLFCNTNAAINVVNPKRLKNCSCIAYRNALYIY